MKIVDIIVTPYYYKVYKEKLYIEQIFLYKPPL